MSGIDYFTEKGDLAICTKMYKLSKAKSSTQPLRYHLWTQHNLSLENTEKCFPDTDAADGER